MRSVGVHCTILADGVLVLAYGNNMLRSCTKGLNHTHCYLQAMGATVASDKSYNFTSDATAAKWLKQTL